MNYVSHVEKLAGSLFKFDFVKGIWVKRGLDKYNPEDKKIYLLVSVEVENGIDQAQEDALSIMMHGFADLEEIDLLWDTCGGIKEGSDYKMIYRK